MKSSHAFVLAVACALVVVPWGCNSTSSTPQEALVETKPEPARDQLVVWELSGLSADQRKETLQLLATEASKQVESVIADVNTCEKQRAWLLEHNAQFNPPWISQWEEAALLRELVYNLSQTQDQVRVLQARLARVMTSDRIYSIPAPVKGAEVDK